jgi:hypothetical protein
MNSLIIESITILNYLKESKNYDKFIVKYSKMMKE